MYNLRSSDCSERFGFYYVNITDPARPRTPKLSAEYYRELVANRELPSDPRFIDPAVSSNKCNASSSSNKSSSSDSSSKKYEEFVYTGSRMFHQRKRKEGIIKKKIP